MLRKRSVPSSPPLQSSPLVSKFHERALRAGSRQCIESPDGYFMPLNVIDNLVYTPIQSYSDKEWVSLLHRHITADTCTSNNLDFVMTDVDNWTTTVSSHTPSIGSGVKMAHGKDSLAKSEMSRRELDLLRYYVIGSWYSASYPHHQNPAERRFGTPAALCVLCIAYACFLQTNDFSTIEEVDGNYGGLKQWATQKHTQFG